MTTKKKSEIKSGLPPIHLTPDIKKTALVLAGGFDQIALIKELQKRGFFIILIDYLEDPPAREFADRHIICSTLDVDSVINIARQERAALVTTACTDQALLTAAKTSEALGLPCYINYETALNVTNKQFMKEKMLESGIPTARHIICDSALQKIDITGLSFPLVVKPVDCNSSKGVHKVQSEKFLTNSVREAIGLSRTGTAIIEEFKEGDEFSVDIYVEERTVKILSITRSEKIRNSRSFTITRSYYPIADDEQERQIEGIARKLVSAFDLNNTPLLLQMIGTPEGFFVLEFSARMGGGSKYRLIEVLSGVDIMACYVDLILGDKPNMQPSRQVNYASCNYIYSQPGIVDRVTGSEKLIEHKIISDLFLYKKNGAIIEKAETSSDRIAGYLITADTLDELKSKETIADSTLAVLDGTGRDIMLHQKKEGNKS